MLIEKGTEHVEEFQLLSTRIPAAIKKAEADVAYHKWAMWYRKKGSTEPTDIITATEVALAKLAYESHQSLALEYGEDVEIVAPELIAFTEKIEKLK